jgi:DNA-binding NtrC family response regulator
VSVIVIDKQDKDREAILGLVQGAEGFDTAAAAQQRLEKPGVDAVVLGVGSPELDRLTRVIAAKKIPIVALAWRDSLYDEIFAMNRRATTFVSRKRLEELPQVLKTLTPHPARDLYREFIVGESEAMQTLLTLVAKVAPTPMNVLIEGESGSGKDVLARVVHAASKLSKAPFVAVNCAAIPASLLESEFFGHVKGAFTDAKTDRAGFFDVADGGTLFLDEIGELPLEFQAKLLRATESGEVRPIGSSAPKRVSVRLLSATNRTLVREVEAGRFRQDLFFRLQQFQLHMPTLQDRAEDIPALIEHFMIDKCADLNPEVTGIEPRAMDMLLAHKFPGNVRELRNLVQSLKVIAEPPLVRVSDLPRYLLASDAVPQPVALAEPRLEAQLLTLTVDLNHGLKTVMTDVMAKVLRAYVAIAGGVIKDAATLAQVPLPTWYRKVREADLTREIPEE